MKEIILFATPLSCSRVPTIALEEIGEPFEYRAVNLMAGEQKSAQYKKINPKGKVPALFMDGEVLTENVAIASFLAAKFPDANLLPRADSELDRARQIADLSFCSATLHPLVTRIARPGFFASEKAEQEVHQAGCEALSVYFDLINSRLAESSWWYGEEWSIMDAYIYWIYWRSIGAGMPSKNCPALDAHALSMEQRPAVQRALAHEQLT